MDLTFVPAQPGYYCFDESFGWVRFDHEIDMLFYRSNTDPPCDCRRVIDPITEAVV